MNTLEIILTSIATLLTCGNAVQFISIRSLRKKMTAEADTANDAVLYKRIAFLDERVSRLEKTACFDKNCKLRK